MDAPTVAAIASAASAAAAAISARTSRQAVTRANAPFVWPAIAVRSRTVDDYGEHIATYHSIGVRLHNDGPGVAFDVRFCVGPVDEATYVIPPVRAMRSGEAVPPHPEPQEQPIRDGMYDYALPGPLSESWEVIVGYRDGLGRRWELRAPVDPHGRLVGPRRVRSRRLQLWRHRSGLERALPRRTA